MKPLGIAQLDERVAYRLDCADKIMVVTKDKKGAVNLQEVFLADRDPLRRAQLIIHLEIQTLICGTAWIKGWAVGIVANQRSIVARKTGVEASDRELQIGGVIYADSADKGARFVELCNQKGIPLVFVQDVTGFMVGSRAEQGGIIKSGAKMVNAVANSVVPKITLFVGNSFGAGNYAMCGKAYGARFLYAWPSAAIAVMGGEQASKTLLAIQLKGRGGEVWEEEKNELLSKIQERYRAAMDPRYAAARLWVDGIIDPVDTREVIARSIACAAQQPEIPEFKTGVLQT